ncbi:hypothetical protein FKP32DRAFT_1639313 [Trametes sanguinea]|nr:hypothetical protein FKP32DRAFT_1639313 [Trametes sanguinea]
MGPCNAFVPHTVVSTFPPKLRMRAVMMFEAFGFSKGSSLAVQKPISATFGRSALADQSAFSELSIVVYVPNTFANIYSIGSWRSPRRFTPREQADVNCLPRAYRARIALRPSRFVLCNARIVASPRLCTPCSSQFFRPVQHVVHTKFLGTNTYR